MRIVLDTTVLVRAHPRSRSLGRKILQTLLEGRHTLIVYNSIIAETTKVLRYSRLQKFYPLADEQVYDHAQFLQSVSEIVVVGPPYLAPLRDVNDLHVIQTAERGEADLLCTMDKDFMRRALWRIARRGASASVMKRHCCR